MPSQALSLPSNTHHPHITLPRQSHKRKPPLTSLFQRQKQFIINASQPASDKIFDVNAFEKFLHDKIKVDNRVGNLGDTVQISQQGDGKIEVVAHIQFSGRYLKYLYVFFFFLSFFLGGGDIPSSSGVFSNSVRLNGWNTKANTKTTKSNRTKKFLKKQQLRDWLRVVSTSPGVYELRFFNVVNDEADDDDE